MIVNFLVIFLFVSCSVIESSEYFFDEKFNKNSRGWIEEMTDDHFLTIENGYYLMENKDSTSNKSSSRCLDRSCFYSLPDSFEIQTSVTMASSIQDTLSCGLLLEGNSFKYEFRFFNTGQVQISEYNFISKNSVNLTDVKNIAPTENILCSVKITGWDFEVFANNMKVGSGKLKCKSWDRIVPFTGKLTKSKVDYLRIIEN